MLSSVGIVSNIKIICITLLLAGVAFSSHAVLLIDKNAKRHQENVCIDMDFIEKYEPRFWPPGDHKTLSISYHTPEEMAEVQMVLYGCDIYAEESKFNPDDEHQDGTVYLIWGYMGNKKDGSLVTVFDPLIKPSKDKLSILNVDPDEGVYSTFEEALNSAQMERILSKWGADLIKIQAFTLKGEDRGLYNLDQSLATGAIQ